MVKNMYSHFTSTTTAYGTRNVRRPATLARLSLNINNIEKTVSIDHTKHKKIPVRINSTFNVIRACMFILLSVLEGTQRVPPTCTIKTSRTALLPIFVCTPPPAALSSPTSTAVGRWSAARLAATGLLPRQRTVLVPLRCPG